MANPFARSVDEAGTLHFEARCRNLEAAECRLASQTSQADCPSVHFIAEKTPKFRTFNSFSTLRVAGYSVENAFRWASW
jgi:hypothetical protein